MKNPLIKICGITSEEEIRYIAKAGIDYAGFVLFFPKSKRNLSLECAKKLIGETSGRRCFGCGYGKPDKRAGGSGCGSRFFSNSNSWQDRGFGYYVLSDSGF